jgi:hypothetical protein
VIIRLAAIVLALLVSGQAALPGGAIQVCRYTGQRMAPCPCPGTKPAEDERVLPQGCCELRQSHPADLTGVLPGLDARLPLVAMVAPAPVSWLPPEPIDAPGPRVRSGHDPPPRERLFLSLRQLLL